MQGFLKEFKAFAIKGNVIDLAVAVIVGGAFGKIVTSIVDNLIMPIVGIFLGGIDFTDRVFGFGGVMLKYGAFVQSVVDFLIIALIIFLAVRALNRLKKPETEVVADKPVEPSDEIKLLTEIRDLLAKREG
jgi:large conductance mechanosensitive channel